MPASNVDNSDPEKALAELVQGSDALMLATINDQGQPEASYTPYVEHQGRYYIFVSQLAAHTGHLATSGHAGILLMQHHDDSHAFTRQRLSCRCSATAIPRHDVLFDNILQQMQQRFGKLIETLRGLGDFQLFQLTPLSGNFVAGFGRAYEVDFSDGGRRLRHQAPSK